MKCPMCNGSGKCYEQKIRYQEIETNRTDFTLAKCHKCNGTGEVQMTNEEWRRTCSTEEFAEWMAQYYCDVNTSDVKEILKNEWIEWLKEVHHAE